MNDTNQKKLNKKLNKLSKVCVLGGGGGGVVVHAFNFDAAESNLVLKERNQALRA